MAKVKFVKTSELQVGKDYFLCYNPKRGAEFKATFMFRNDIGIYFKPLEEHIFVESSTHEGLLGFDEGMLEAEGFVPVEQ